METTSTVFLLFAFMPMIMVQPRELSNKVIKEDLKGQFLKYAQLVVDGTNLIHQPSFQHMAQHAGNVLYKLHTCKPETKLELFNIAVRNYGDFQACVNATRDIADFEVFSYHVYEYLVLTEKNLVGVAKDVFSCHTQSNIFEVIKCILTNFENSGPKFAEILQSAKDCTIELQNDIIRITTHIKNCFTSDKTELFGNVLNLIHNHC